MWTTTRSPKSSHASSTIGGRLSTDILFLPSPSYSSELNGIDNLYYPDFMEGEWSVTQTLVNVQTPLGKKFLGGPNGSDQIAESAWEEARGQLDRRVSLRLRYVKTKWGVAEDRLYNTKQRLDSFAGRKVVSSVYYADVGGSNRPSVLAMGGTRDDPLQTTIVQFRGPAAQKTFVVSHGIDTTIGKNDIGSRNNSNNDEGRNNDGAHDDDGENVWIGYEVDRSIFALTNTNTAPPVTTDTELVWRLERVDDDRVSGRLRVAAYLNAQSDILYFEARNRAVSLQDYDVQFVRRSEREIDETS